MRMDDGPMDDGPMDWTGLDWTGKKRHAEVAAAAATAAVQESLTEESAIVEDSGDDLFGVLVQGLAREPHMMLLFIYRGPWRRRLAFHDTCLGGPEPLRHRRWCSQEFGQ